MVKHCCKNMSDRVCYVDDIYANSYDNLEIENDIIYYSSKFREYGIPIRNGNEAIASSYIVIRYCPWCGSQLPSSKRAEWFETLEKLGFDEPLSQQLPNKFYTSKWYDK